MTKVDPDTTIVIVGAGQAGFQVALSLRERGHSGPVHLIGEEPELPYNRPPLSKSYITDATSADSTHLRGAQFYASRDIAVHNGVKVTHIDRRVGRVRLAQGGWLAFDHLVLATGARARALPIRGGDLDGVLNLRTLADATALRKRIAGAHRDVVLVGGGFIGLELAAATIAAGHRVTVVENADRLMARAVSRELSDHVAARHRKEGTRVLLSATVRSIHGREGRATAIELADGEVIPADVIILGVGAEPNVELAAEAGLDICPVTRGVRVDRHLLTSDRRISAVGDCATYPSRYTRSDVRLESVQNAVDHGRHVAERLVSGSTDAYGKVPWFWTAQFDMKIQLAGIGGPKDKRLTIGDLTAGAFSVLRFDADRLVAVESVNRPADHMAARRILAGGSRPDLSEAGSPGFTLKSFVPVAP